MGVGDEYFARTLTAVTGIEYATGDLIRAGERIWNLERLYNLREGFTRADDTLPQRLLEEPVADGPSKGWVSQLEPMLKEYYRARGWDENGVPKPAKLQRSRPGGPDGGGLMIDERIYEQFCEIGRDLYVGGMISSHGGNISIRLGDRVIIKRRGAHVGPPEAARPDRDRPGEERQRRGPGLHRADRPPRHLSCSTPALAVVHCHPRTAIAFSLSRDEIVPDRQRGLLPAQEGARGHRRVCLRLAGNGQQGRRGPAVQYKIVMLRGHGSFAIGQTLDEAFHWSSTLEESCQIALAAKIINEPFIEYRGMTKDYSKW